MISTKLCRIISEWIQKRENNIHQKQGVHSTIKIFLQEILVLLKSLLEIDFIEKILKVSLQSMRWPNLHNLIIIVEISEYILRCHKVDWYLTRSTKILQDLLKSQKIYWDLTRSTEISKDLMIWYFTFDIWCLTFDMPWNSMTFDI